MLISGGSRGYFLADRSSNDYPGRWDYFFGESCARGIERKSPLNFSHFLTTVLGEYTVRRSSMGDELVSDEYITPYCNVWIMSFFIPAAFDSVFCKSNGACSYIRTVYQSANQMSCLPLKPPPPHTPPKKIITLINQIWEIGTLLFFQHGQTDRLMRSYSASASGAFYLWAAAGIETKTIALWKYANPTNLTWPNQFKKLHGVPIWHTCWIHVSLWKCVGYEWSWYWMWDWKSVWVTWSCYYETIMHIYRKGC